MPRNATTLKVDGYEISATFAETGGILAAPPVQRYNKDGDRHHVP